MAGTDEDKTSTDATLGATIDMGGEAPEEVPKWLGQRYRIIRLLGQGGMGAVYLAIDQALVCEVALKMVTPELAGLSRGLSQFRDEVRLAQKVTHPNVCRTYDLEEIDGNWLVKMEYVAGETLAQRLKPGPVSVAEAVQVTREVCAGLSAAHRQGVVHRDLKPHNIMLEAKTGRVVLMDFGIARAAALAGRTAEDVSGTPQYMAPEQVRGREVDGRADLYSLGCVLYEMLTGARVFPRATAMAAALAHVNDPAPALPSSVPPRVARVVVRLLEKDPARRPADAAEVAAALATSPRKRWWFAAAAIALLAILAGWLSHNASRARWARQTATPEVDRLFVAQEYAKAAALASEALAVLPGDATLENLWTWSTVPVSVDSIPAGADVLYRPYRSAPQSWTRLGGTPLSKVRIPRDSYVWQISKPGFLPAWRISSFFPPGYSSLELVQPVRLVPPADVPPEMVSVPGSEVEPDMPGIKAPMVVLDDFLLDRHEVTNEEYKAFVDAGGYRRPELWKEPFVRDGRPIPWDQAMAVFQDATGRPGPSTWELGSFPKDRRAHPVAGVSWYEAAAYAAFVEKSLPTLYHWNWASQPRSVGLVVPGSNFGETGTVPVAGHGALNAFGTYDMAGNVKEWCVNEGQGGKRYVLGGGFGEPTYMALEGDTQSPWSRSPNIGFRCAKLSGPLAPAAARPIEKAFRDYRAEKPVSDEVYRAFKSQYAYDRTDLNARVESTEETEDWIRERVSFDAAYGGERVIAYLYLPKSARPPFQTVVYFPGSATIFVDKFVEAHFNYIPTTGRALLAPIFKGTFERRDELKTDYPEPTAFWRDHMVSWSKDLGRSLDYLETRNEIDRSRIAYLGFSWGGAVAPMMLAVEQRFKVAVLVAGGIYFGRTLPEVDPINFAGQVRIPVLMLNGRYDTVFPVETSQQPLFELFGTPAERKKHIVYEGGHVPRFWDVIRECLSWLDTYLGPVDSASEPAAPRTDSRPRP